MTWRVAAAAAATIGTRSKQEDSSAIWPSGAPAALSGGEGMLAVVADGMGGHAGGDIAGDLACRTFVATFAQAEGTIAERLRPSLEAGNAAIGAHAADDGRLRGMGCTLIAAWVDDTGLSWVSVGDSLLLLFRSPEVLRLNADHSLGAFLDDQARRNQISPDEAQRNPYRNALRSALTGKTLELVDLQTVPYELAAGDWIILASDGIATLTGDEIGDIVYENRDGTPEVMADALIAAVEAKQDPDQDNTTVVVLRMDEGAEGESAGQDEDTATRVLRPESAATSAGPSLSAPPVSEGGVKALGTLSPRPAAPPARRSRGMIIGLGMAAMFLVGWLLRAVLS